MNIEERLQLIETRLDALEEQFTQILESFKNIKLENVQNQVINLNTALEEFKCILNNLNKEL